MMPDHQIRLRGPWQLSLTQRAGDRIERTVPCRRFDAPHGLADCLPDGYAGWIRLERSFHRPSGLSERSRVRLWIDSNLVGELSANDRKLGPIVSGANTFDVTPILLTRNRICLDVLIDACDSMRQPSCDARLEIFD
jgi:hypothetical protein